MRTASPGRAFPIVLCVIVMAIAVAATYGIAGRATAAKNVDGAITVPLPECDVAAQTDADGFCRFTGTDIQHIGQTGEPSIPYQSVRVLLPPNADLTTVKATITGSRWTAIDGEWDIPPVPPLAAGDRENTCAVSPTNEAIIDGRTRTSTTRMPPSHSSRSARWTSRSCAGGRWPRSSTHPTPTTPSRRRSSSFPGMLLRSPLKGLSLESSSAGIASPVLAKFER